MDNYAVKSYRYLRIAMITVILMLGVAVVVEWMNTRSGCLQESISAYYYTPVQSIFVGALITIGVCMVALKGTSDGEDVFLNLGGMLAPIVALVPTPEPGRCRSVGVAVAAAPENIQNNVIALFFAGFIGLVVGAVTLIGPGTGKPKPVQIWGAVGAVLIFLGGVGWFVLDRSGFDRGAHYTAAITLFVCIVIVAVLNSLRQRVRYGTVAILMVVSGLGLGFYTWRTGWAHGVLVVEATLILLFAVFWAVQTQEFWKKLPPPPS